MSNFAFEILDEVESARCTFRKLVIDQLCLYDKFCTEIARNTTYGPENASILAYMELWSTGHMLPKTKFSPIHGVTGGCEFKSKHLRVYAIQAKPDVYIILGGMKTTQKMDIERLQRIAKELRSKGII